MYKEQVEAARVLESKYRAIPRTGWAAKGSRAKDNQTVTVLRKEIVELAFNHQTAVLGNQCNFYEVQNLINYMEQLAETNVIDCPECCHTYSKDWMEGKCPYCKAEAAAHSMVFSTENSGRSD